MTVNLHKHFQPQLDEIISDKLGVSCPPSCLLEPLTNVMYWWQNPAYENIKLEYEHVYMTIVAWMNAVEIITGSNEAFNLDLIEQIRSTVETQWEIKMQEWQEDYQHEYKEAVGA